MDETAGVIKGGKTTKNNQKFSLVIIDFFIIKYDLESEKNYL